MSPSDPSASLPRAGRLSLAARGTLLLITAAACAGVPAFLAQRLTARSEAQRAADLVAPFLAAGVRAELESATDTPTEASTALIGWLAGQQEKVHWAGLWRADSEPIEFVRHPSVPLPDILAQLSGADRSASGAQPLLVGGRPHADQQLVSIPTEGGGVLGAIVTIDARAATNEDLRLAGVIAGGVFGVVVCAALFVALVLRPIQRLGRALTDVQSGLGELARADGAPAELTALAETFAQTQRDLLRYRGEAASLRHSLDTTIEAKTRQVSRALRKAERDADTDALSGVANRRALERRAAELTAESRSARRELVALVIDINNFKRLNDQHGHTLGDEVIGFTGGLLRAALRDGDFVARYGGDEFAVLMPGAALAQATSVAERIAALFLQRARTLPAVDPPLGISIGAAGLMQCASGTWEELVKLADQAMYQAKRNGRPVVACTIGQLTPEHARR